MCCWDVCQSGGKARRAKSSASVRSCRWIDKRPEQAEPKKKKHEGIGAAERAWTRPGRPQPASTVWTRSARHDRLRRKRAVAHRAAPSFCMSRHPQLAASAGPHRRAVGQLAASTHELGVSATAARQPDRLWRAGRARIRRGGRAAVGAAGRWTDAGSRCGCGDGCCRRWRC